jgi:hypothetical protein
MEQNAYTVGQENFNLPHDVIQLPSGGVFYKSKKKSVKIGYLTANDENFLVGSAISGKDNIVNTLIKNKLYEHDLRPEELIDGDIESILIFLRNTSFGPEYNVKLEDPQTGKIFNTTIVLDELNIKKTNIQPDEYGLFSVKLPKSNSNVKLRPLILKDSLEMEKMVESYPPNMVPPRITWKLQRQIVEVDGNEDKSVISTFVNSLPILDSKFIRNFLKENTPSLDLRKQVRTPSGDLVMVDITFGVEFFRPFF